MPLCGSLKWRRRTRPCSTSSRSCAFCWKKRARPLAKLQSAGSKSSSFREKSSLRRPVVRAKTETPACHLPTAMLLAMGTFAGCRCKCRADFADRLFAMQKTKNADRGSGSSSRGITTARQSDCRSCPVALQSSRMPMPLKGSDSGMVAVARAPTVQGLPRVH